MSEFNIIDGETLDELTAVGQTQDYPPGAIICHQGEFEETFYVILDGAVKVTQRLENGEERELEVRGNGHYFGEMALLDDKPRMADVTTAAPTRLLEISRAQFLDLLQRNPAVAYSMTRRILSTLRRMDSLALDELREQNVALQQAYRDLAAAQEALQLQEAIKKELAIGQQIQASFLPQTYPQFDGWEVASYFQAAREVAGDFYDLFPVANNRRLALVVADVCDKGVGAALFMALTRSLIRAYADQNYSSDLLSLLTDDAPAFGETTSNEKIRRRLPVTGSNALRKTVKLVNNYIANIHGHTNMFATVFFALLDPLTGQLSYINGGHEPPLILGADGRVKAELAPTGPAVGLLPDMDFQIGAATLEPGETLLAFTDGITEAKNWSNSLYGVERLTTAARGQRLSAADLLSKITKDVAAFTAGAEQSDDITMLTARRLA
jgi:phosphoserine phosphatase RsbU/P